MLKKVYNPLNVFKLTESILGLLLFISLTLLVCSIYLHRIRFNIIRVRIMAWPFFSVQEQRVMPSYSECILLWMPRTQADFLWHVNFEGLPCLISEHALHSLALVGPVLTHIFTPLLHELGINCAVSLILQVNYMHVRIIGPCQYQVGVRRYLQIKFVKNSLALINLAQLFLKVVSSVECLAWHLRIPHIPDLNC